MRFTKNSMTNRRRKFVFSFSFSFSFFWNRTALCLSLGVEAWVAKPPGDRAIPVVLTNTSIFVDEQTVPSRR